VGWLAVKLTKFSEGVSVIQTPEGLFPLQTWNRAYSSCRVFASRISTQTWNHLICSRRHGHWQHVRKVTRCCQRLGMDWAKAGDLQLSGCSPVGSTLGVSNISRPHKEGLLRKSSRSRGTLCRPNVDGSRSCSTKYTMQVRFAIYLVL
jgi:hypothetical protein